MTGRKAIFISMNAFALGLYAQGSFHYLDYLYGFEFGLLVYGIIFLSLMFPAVYNKNNVRAERVFIYISSFGLVLYGFLTETSINSHIIYFLMLCATIILIAYSQGCVMKSQNKYNNLEIIMPVSVAGMAAAYVLLLQLDSLFPVLLMAAGVVLMSIVLTRKKPVLIDIVTTAAAMLVLIFLNNALVKSHVPAWLDDLTTKPVSQYILYKNNIYTGQSDWTHYGRIDRLVLQYDQQDTHSYLNLISGNSAMPVYMNIEGYAGAKTQKYPLLMLPQLVVRPKSILDVGEWKHVGKAENEVDATSVDRLVLYSNDSMKVDEACKISLAQCINKIDNNKSRFDLIEINALMEENNSWLRGSVQAQAFLSADMLNWYFSHLTDDGLLAIVFKDEYLFSKVLVNVWEALALDGGRNVMGFEDKIVIYRLGKYANNRGMYDYLIMASKTGIADNILVHIEEAVASLPVEALIYNNQAQKPYSIISSMDLDIEKSVLQMRKYLSARLGVNVTLESSSLWRPSLYNLTKEMHPFLVAMYTVVLLFTIYGLVISKKHLRAITLETNSKYPAASILLLQSMLCIIAAAFIVIMHIFISVASLGMGNYAVVITLALIMAGYILGQKSKKQHKVAGVKTHVPIWMSLLLLCVVYTGWYALSLLEMRHVFSIWSYIFMCSLTFLTGVVTGVLHKHALENIWAEYTELSSWSLILTGAGVIHGILVAVWLVNGGDLMLLLNYAAILYIYILAVHYWASYANDQAREQVKVARI